MRMQVILGRVVQTPIKLTQRKREFWFQFCNFLVRCSVYFVCSSVLSCSNLKLHQTLEVKNIFKQEKIMPQLTFNPGLTLTGFRTTRPWTLLSPARVQPLYGAGRKDSSGTGLPTWRTVIKANAYAAFARSYAGIDLEDGMISLVKVTEQW